MPTPPFFGRYGPLRFRPATPCSDSTFFPVVAHNIFILFLRRRRLAPNFYSITALLGGVVGRWPCISSPALQLGIDSFPPVITIFTNTVSLFYFFYPAFFSLFEFTVQTLSSQQRDYERRSTVPCGEILFPPARQHSSEKGLKCRNHYLGSLPYAGDRPLPAAKRSATGIAFSFNVESKEPRETIASRVL